MFFVAVYRLNRFNYSRGKHAMLSIRYTSAIRSGKRGLRHYLLTRNSFDCWYDVRSNYRIVESELNVKRIGIFLLNISFATYVGDFNLKGKITSKK